VGGLADRWTMPLSAPRPTSKTRRWLLAWVSIVLVASLANIAAWVWHVGGPVRIVSNLAWLFGLPGWVPVYATGMRSVRADPAWILAANSVAWAFWLIAARLLLAVRSRIHTTPGSQETEPPPSPSRRAFLANSGVGVLSAGFVAAPGYATAVEPWILKTRRYTVPILDLPPAFEGLKIVQFADPHLGPRIPASFVEAAVEQAIGLAPDVVVFNGDYVAGGTVEVERAAEIMRPLAEAASIGAVGVLGNHDWWADGAMMRDAMERAGVRMIDNGRVWIDPASRLLIDRSVQSSLALVGLGDLGEDETDTERAFAGVHGKTPRIVAAHQPDSAELHVLRDPGGPRIDLMLSGHTHGGQVRIPFLGTPLVPSHYGQKYAGGLVRGPRFPVLVSRGVGMSLLPVRVGVPPEISLITLTAG